MSEQHYEVGFRLSSLPKSKKKGVKKTAHCPRLSEAIDARIEKSWLIRTDERNRQAGCTNRVYPTFQNAKITPVRPKLVATDFTDRKFYEELNSRKHEREIDQYQTRSETRVSNQTTASTFRESPRPIETRPTTGEWRLRQMRHLSDESDSKGPYSYSFKVRCEAPRIWKMNKWGSPASKASILLNK